MKKKAFSIIITAFIISISPLINPGNFLLGKEKKSIRSKIKQLDKKYRDWLDLVHYIITPNEKDVFFKLTNNRDRDTFINLFWKLRDPTKGTPENEYKEEHIKRFIYANRYFKFDSPKPGWKNDRGRIHILLGPPLSKNEIIKNELRPVEIWEYLGDPQNGLPTAFRVVFYRRAGSDGYKLYVPIVDGPASLLTTIASKVDLTDNYKVYKKIKELEPQVAEIAFTLIPGEKITNFSPSLQGLLLMSKIAELPKRRIDATYARNFLNYKGIVETSVTTDYIDVTCDLYTIKDPILDLNFVHFAVLPERISVDYSKETEKYYFNFTLMVILKRGEDVILQYEKNFPFYFTEEELDKKLSHGIIITDYFPIIEGKFKFISVLQNAINKEISYFEKIIDTSAGERLTATPNVYDPIISYQIDMNEQMISSPFTIMGRKIKIDPKRIFGLREPISFLFCVEKGNYKKDLQLELEVECLDESKKYFKNYSFDFPEGKTFWCFSRNLEPLNYGNYSLKVKAVGEKGVILDINEKDFQVSPLSYVPHPPLAAKTMKIENQFLFNLMTATQYQKINEFSRAETYYEKALRLNSKFPNLIKTYASFLLSRKKYDKMLSIIENLKGQDKEAFHYHAFKGRALYYKQKYNAAVDALLEANKIYDSDISVLNTLGFSLIRIGQKEDAVNALVASLKINNDQKDILKILDQLQNNKKKKKNEKSK